MGGCAMLVLGLDLGANAGFAICGQHDSLRVCWSRKYSGGTAARPERMAGLMADLRDAIEQWEPGVVAYELPLSKGRASNAARRALFGFAGVVEAVAFAAGLPTLDINVQHVKHHASAMPTAGKEPMIAAAKLLGFDPQNEHEADASVLADFVARRMVVEQLVTKARRKARAA